MAIVRGLRLAPRLVAAWLAALLVGAVAADAQTFSDVTVIAGFGAPDDVQGVAWADADGDGDLDIYLTLVLSSFTSVGNQLYINNGPPPRTVRRFTEHGVAFGVADAETSFGACLGDMDSDGDQDIIVGSGANALIPNALALYVNQSPGTFRDEAAARGLGGPGSGRSVIWADIDNDRDLDFFLCTPNFLLFGERYYLFRNDGATFTDVTATVGLAMTQMNTDGAAFADYDRDGDVDLYVANHGLPPLTERNELWKNQLKETGRLSFVNVAQPLGVNDDGASTGAAWGDCDNDGDLDLYVSTGVDIFSIFGINSPNRLYLNNGDGTFTGDVAPARGVDDSGQVSFSAAWGDLDNDGFLDLYVTNSVLNTADPADKVFHNRGNCVFDTVDAGASDSGSGQGTALGDYDGDGDLDIFVANILSSGSLTSHLYDNDSPPQHWLHVDTIGTASNTDGIGALVDLFAGGQQQTRHVHAGSGYLSEDSLDVEFGLGATTSVDRIEIHWPSGCFQVVPSPAIDRKLAVVEDCSVRFAPGSFTEQPCDTGVVLDWPDATFASMVGHYEVHRSMVSCADALLTPPLDAAAGRPWTDVTTAAGGTYSYALVAVDDINGTRADTCVGPVTDVNGGGFTPTASASPDPACVGEDVTYSAAGPAGATFDWDFDLDGTPDASGAVVTHAWAAPGTPIARVIVTSAEGCVVTSDVPVDVTGGLATVVDPASLRVTKSGLVDPFLTWTIVSGPGASEVHRNLDRFAWAAGPATIPIVATPAVPQLLDVIPLTPGQCAYYQVFGASGCP